MLTRGTTNVGATGEIGIQFVFFITDSVPPLLYDPGLFSIGQSPVGRSRAGKY